MSVSTWVGPPTFMCWRVHPVDSMSVTKSVEDIDSPFLWRSAVITILWLALFTLAAILLIIFQDPIRDLFFG